MFLHEQDTLVTADDGSVVIGLSPGSYLLITSNSFIRIVTTDLTAMHFDLENGEVIVKTQSFDNGVSFALHTPPVHFNLGGKGLYRIRVGKDGNTEANVVNGYLKNPEKHRVLT